MYKKEEVYDSKIIDSLKDKYIESEKTRAKFMNLISVKLF